MELASSERESPQQRPPVGLHAAAPALRGSRRLVSCSLSRQPATARPCSPALCSALYALQYTARSAWPPSPSTRPPPPPHQRPVARPRSSSPTRSTSRRRSSSSSRPRGTSSCARLSFLLASLAAQHADPPPAPLADAQQLVARRVPRRLPRRQVRRRRGDVPALQGCFHEGALPSPSSGRAGGC